MSSWVHEFMRSRGSVSMSMSMGVCFADYTGTIATGMYTVIL
jgi:hypothetical protein